MTLAIHFEHECPECFCFYIPAEGIPCPSCGFLEEKRYSFIEQAAEAALYNLATEGSYAPASWHPGTQGEHILCLLLQLLEEHRREGGTFAEEASRKLSRMQWGQYPHLQGHLYAIALRLYERIRQQ